jgi:hypothetical protein
MNNSFYEIDQDHLINLDFENYKENLDKILETKKKEILKRLKSPNSPRENPQEEEDIKKEFDNIYEAKVLEEDSKFEDELKERKEILRENYQKEYIKKEEDLKNEIDKKILYSIEIKKNKNENLRKIITQLENEIDNLKKETDKEKNKSKNYIGENSNNYDEEISLAEEEIKKNLKFFLLNYENKHKQKIEKIDQEYQIRLNDLNQNTNQNTNSLSQNDIDLINNDFKTKKESLIMENQEKIKKSKDELIAYFDNLLNEEKNEMQISINSYVNSLKENLNIIKSFYLSKIQMYDIEYEISTFNKIPGKINEFTNKINEIFGNLSTFNKLIFEKIYKELENNNEISRVYQKEKIYKIIFEYFSSILLQIILEYSIDENRENQQILDKLINKVTFNLDNVLNFFPVDKRIQLNLEIKEPNLMNN